MSTEKQKRWREISPYLDEALDLDGPELAQWLRDLAGREPAIAEAVRSLLAEREGADRNPLLSEGRTAVLASAGLAGQQLGAYTLDSMVGHGGMGTVWLAHRSDGRYEGRAAVKLLNAALLGRPSEQRFVREGSVLARLQHPHIAQLVDAGVAPSGQPYLVLEYIEGEHIDRYAERHNLSIEARVRLFLDVLAAVAHAHRHLVVHRDIKPSNILVTPAGVVKLLDFGIAALLGPEDAHLTREVDAGLTPEYAAPEQLLRQPVTTATDVYALGVVLFYLLAGRHPLAPEGKSAPELARATLDRDMPRPSELAAQGTESRTLRGDLDNIVARALKKDPNERYSTAEFLAQDLRAFLSHQPVSAQPDSLTYRAGKFVRRHRGGVATGALMALALLGAAVVTTLQMLEARRQRDAALYQSRRAEFQSRFAYQIMSEAGGDGRPITIRQLMEKGVEVLDKSYGDDPRFVIGMLINMSGRYMDLGDTKGEYAVLVKAERIARKLGDPLSIAFVQCNTVETELASGRPREARERMRDGLANLAKVRNPSSDRVTDCGLAQARLLWSEGKLPEAIEAATKVASLMEAQDETADLSYQTASSMLEVMLAREGRRREAMEWNRRTRESLEHAGRSGTMSMFMARHNHALNLYWTGQFKAALDVQQAIVDQITTQQGAEDLPPYFATSLGSYQVRVQETDAGLAWLDRSVSGTRALHDRHDQINSLLSRAQAHLLLNRPGSVLADIEEAEHLGEANPQDNLDFMRRARFIRAQWLLSGAQASAALEAVDALLAEVGYPRQLVVNRLTHMLTLKARAELALGRNEAALSTARAALAAAEAVAIDPALSADAGSALMALAAAQRAHGDIEGARSSARRAAVALTAGLGPEHSETKAALAFR